MRPTERRIIERARQWRETKKVFDSTAGREKEQARTAHRISGMNLSEAVDLDDREKWEKHGNVQAR